ncbi:hypothetical protein [Pseudomonas entomophila]|uniref:hypothetical protein n=1 Tax=Pseudomonas entomophila TaxID=312306 RepID=UPI001F0142A0|nr:hypothetical protein [Pseudomonas entomophila]MCG8291283.1 hypothetical protein [Pseudomonas entomophila]
MLVRFVPERAFGALFGCQEVSELLRLHLKQWLSERANSPKATFKAGTLRKKLCEVISADIDSRAGKRLRLNEAQQAAECLCGNTLLDSRDIATFEESIDSLMVWNEDVLHFREEMVQRYAELVSEIDPTVLAAYSLATRIERQSLSIDSVQRVLAAQSTLFVSRRFASAPVAEGHVHLLGVAGDGFVLAQLVFAGQWPKGLKEDDPLAFRLHRIRRMVQSLCSSLGACIDSDPVLSDEHNAVLVTAGCDDTLGTTQGYPGLDWLAVRDGIVLDDLPSEDRAEGEEAIAVSDRGLLRNLADAAGNYRLQEAWMCFFLLLWRTYRKRHVKSIYRATILLMIADIMILRRELIMEGSGLRRFTKGYFHSPIRRAAFSHDEKKELQLQETAAQILFRQGDKAEIKVGAESLGDGEIVGVFFRAANARMCPPPGSDSWLPVYGSLGHSEQGQRHWHLCAHFNRFADSTRAVLWESAVKLSDVLNSAQHWRLSRPFDGYLDPSLEHTALPADVIRGLDLVGDETQWPIEWCAPMFRWLRKPRHSPTDLLPTPKVDLHLSIHAGEDYGHPLSGLRRVNETVRFCGMRAGDRLGHALALGIPPDEWLKRHGEALLPVDEHLDNLVWAWHEALKLRHVKTLRAPIERLKGRIARMVKHVPWCTWGKKKEISENELRMLYRAWKLRRNCSKLLFETNGEFLVADQGLAVAAVPDYSRLRHQIKKPAADTPEGLYILRAQHEARTHGHSVSQCQVRVSALTNGRLTRCQAMLEADEVVAPGASPNYLYDHDDRDDLDLMLAIQDASIERYARLGLSIETNPSSNVYIGQLETHSDHPIYRWNPPAATDWDEVGEHNTFKLRKRPMPVTINTDDPGLIPTTLRMEYHLIHEGAMDHGSSMGDADEWIESIRRYGLSRFDAVH